MLKRTLPAVAVALATVTAPGAMVHADEKPSVLVVPLSGQPTGDLADAPAKLTSALESAATAAGMEATVAQVARDELMAVAGCTDESVDCFVQVAETLGAASVVVGDVKDREGGGLDVTLSLAGEGAETRTATFIAIGADLAAVVANFEMRATAFFKGEEIPADPVPDPDPPPDAGPPPDPIVTPDPGFSLGRVKGYSWGVVGSGVAIAATGAVFLGLASGKQSDVDDHPTDTVEDLEALADIEADGKRYNRLGNAMLVVGGIATAVGIVLIVKQGRDAPEERQPGVTVTPVPLRGGAGVVVTYDGWSW